MDSFYMALALLSLVTLYLASTQVDACSCMPSHPQDQFCRSHWVIKGIVKSNKVVNLEDGFATRVYGVKVSKVFKEHRHFQQGEYVKIYTSEHGSMCGVSNLKIDSTFIIQGSFYDGQAYINLCDAPQLWYRLSPVVQKGYRYLYKNSCQCQAGNCYPRAPGDCANACALSMATPYAERQCYNENAICRPDTSFNEIPIFPEAPTTCSWSKRGLFNRCMAKAKVDDGSGSFAWEP